MVANNTRRKCRVASRTKKKRCKQYFKLPKSISEFCQTLAVLQPISNNNEDVVLFNDDKIITMKMKCVELTFADGTFFWCPKLFTQVFTVHTLHENVWILLPFLLLHNKSTESYRKLFFILKSEREKIILLNKPLASFVDLELSIHYEIRQLLPKTEV